MTALSSSKTVWLNGSFLDKSRATISITDYGFNYGAGVYEVTRVEQGKKTDCHLLSPLDGNIPLRVSSILKL
jgi:branched-subunit amino acid aminotransferase/4-amino-4-deoxychorismate lyase